MSLSPAPSVRRSSAAPPARRSSAGHPVLRSSAALLLAAVLLTGCTSNDDLEVEVARVGPGEVVQTVAAAGELEPAGEVQVSAPAGGEVEELLVGDGDVVSAGDPLVQLASDGIDQQVEQAQAAVDAADALAADTGDLGVDVSPVIASFRQQLDATFPPLISALSAQVSALEQAVGDARRTAQAQLDEAEAQLEAAQEGAQEAAREAAREQLDTEELEALEELGEDLDLDLDLDLDVDLGSVRAGLEEGGDLEAALADTRRQLADAEAGYRSATGELAATETQLRDQADQASEAQQAAVQAQREQAELALEAARARIDDLRIVAPVSGVVELTRGGEVGAGAIGGLEGLDAGALDPDAAAGQLPDGLDDLLGGGGTPTTDGPIEEGIEVAAGQPLLTIYDLSSFTARAEVDEIDIVEVEVGQDVLVLLDAFPDVELAGVVDRIALRPNRPAGGGAIYPVYIRLVEVPSDLRLRIGLTAASEIEVRRVDADLVVPTSALLRRGGAEVVHVVEDGVVREVPVTLDALGDQTAAVSGDLQPGDQVVTVGVELVEDGSEVEVVG